MEELNLAYKMQANYIGSDDTLAPKAAFLRTAKYMGGYKNYANEYFAMVSSVDQLFEMISDRIRQSGPRRNGNTDQRRNQPNQNKRFNFNNIENLLDIQAEQVQELEAQILMKIAHTKRFLTFNNESIENLPQAVRRAAKNLANGHQFNATKWFNQEQITIAFPLATGLPFLFTYKTPSVMRAGGEIRLQTNPDWAQGNDDEIRAPKSINATAEIDFLYATQTDARVGFLTLFDHQRYVAGVQKKIQARLPMRLSLSVDVTNDQVSAEMEPLDKKNDITLFHASCWPYTERRHIQAAYDNTKEVDTKLISVNDANEYDQRFGQASTGMVIHVNAKYEKEFIDGARVMEYLQRNDLVSLAMYTSALESNEYYQIRVELDNQKSQAQSVKVKMQFDSEASFENGEDKPKHPKDTTNPKNYAHPQNTDANSKGRREQFMRNAGAGIANAQVNGVDASISFQGPQQKSAQYIATIAFANSKVNNQQRLLAFFSSNEAKNSNYQMCLHAEQYMPNVVQLNFKNALPQSENGTMRVELDFGDKCKNGQHVTIKAKMYQSNERQQHVAFSPLGKQCKEEMKQGNYQMPACQNATYQANVYDQYALSAEFENLSYKAKQGAFNIYAYLRHLGFAYADENVLKPEGKSKQVQGHISFAPNMRYANFSLDSAVVSTEWINVPVPSWAKYLPVHPDNDVIDRLAYQATNGQSQGIYRLLTFSIIFLHSYLFNSLLRHWQQQNQDLRQQHLQP